MANKLKLWATLLQASKPEDVAVGCISKDSFCDLHVRVLKCLHKHFDEDSMRVLAEVPSQLNGN